MQQRKRCACMRKSRPGLAWPLHRWPRHQPRPAHLEQALDGVLAQHARPGQQRVHRGVPLTGGAPAGRQLGQGGAQVEVVAQGGGIRLRLRLRLSLRLGRQTRRALACRGRRVQGCASSHLVNHVVWQLAQAHLRWRGIETARNRLAAQHPAASTCAQCWRRGTLEAACPIRALPCPGPTHRTAANHAGELKRRLASLTPAEALPCGQCPLEPQLAGLQAAPAVLVGDLPADALGGSSERCMDACGAGR